MVSEKTNIEAKHRADDNAVVIGTDAYVSHKKGSGPWRSTFSMSIHDAIRLRDQLTFIIQENRR